MDLTDIIQIITGLALSVVPIVTALALLYFFWGIAISLFNTEDKEAMKKGRARMFWGLIAIFIIVSLGGILLLLQRTFFNSNLHAVTYGVPQGLPTGNTQNPINTGSSPFVPFDPLHDDTHPSGGGGVGRP